MPSNQHGRAADRADRPFFDELRRLTAAYCAVLEDCCTEVRAVLAPDGDRTGHVGDLESRCDELHRDLETHVAREMAPNFSQFYLQRGDFVRLFQLLDEVPNGAERFVDEFVAVDPALPPADREVFVGQAERLGRAATALAALVTEYVSHLGTGSGTFEPGDALDRIRKLESDCDGVKSDAMARWYADGVTAEANARRALLVRLDAVVNSVEDVADHVDYMASRTV